MSTYVFDLIPDDNGTYLATCAAFPEITTFVEEPGELFGVGLSAVEEAIAARISDSREIPDPATPAEVDTVGTREDGSVRAWVRLPLLIDLKVMLYQELRGQGLTRAELQRRLGWNRESVDRLFRLDHGSRVGQIEDALLKLGRHVITHTVATSSGAPALVGAMVEAARRGEAAGSGSEAA